MPFTWGFQVARARGIFLSEDPEHLSSSMTSRVGLSWRTYSVRVIGCWTVTRVASEGYYNCAPGLAAKQLVWFPTEEQILIHVRIKRTWLRVEHVFYLSKRPHNYFLWLITSLKAKCVCDRSSPLVPHTRACSKQQQQQHSN